MSERPPNQRQNRPLERRYPPPVTQCVYDGVGSPRAASKSQSCGDPASGKGKPGRASLATAPVARLRPCLMLTAIHGYRAFDVNGIAHSGRPAQARRTTIPNYPADYGNVVSTPAPCVHQRQVHTSLQWPTAHAHLVPTQPFPHRPAHAFDPPGRSRGAARRAAAGPYAVSQYSP